MKQATLFDPHYNQPVRVEPPAIAAPVDEQKRLGGQNGLILVRLEKGPATNVELEDISGSRRINSRIADLQKWLKSGGRTITTECVDSKSGLYRYTIAETVDA